MFWLVNFGAVVLLGISASIVVPDLWLDPFGALAKNIGLAGFCVSQALLDESN